MTKYIGGKFVGVGVLVLVGFFGLFGLLGLVGEANAQTTLDKDAAAAAGIPRGVQVSPIRFESDLVPGQSWYGTVNLKNFADEYKTLTLSAENFVVTADTQSATFYPSGDAKHLESPDIIDWFSIPQKTITLAPGEASSVSFGINVPHDAPTGGYYGALFFLISGDTVGGEGGTAKLGINSRMGVLVLFRVRGNEPVRIDGRLERFGATRDVYFRAPAMFNTTIYNSGNLHFRGEGELVVSRFGKQVAQIPLISQVNYPDRYRTYENSWDFGLFSFGKYAAVMSYKSMSGLVVLEAQDSFWVIPWIPVAIVLIAILVLIGIGRFVTSRYSFIRK